MSDVSMSEMSSMKVIGALIAIVVLAGSAASAECLPSGRDSFAAGLEALSRGDLQTAYGRFDELVKAQPDCAEARNNLAVVLFEMGRPEEADKQLRQAVELNPDYQRARFNLRRVEGSFRGEATKPEIENAVPGEPTPVPTQAPTTAPTAALAQPTESVSSPVPANLAALEPQDATACVVDAARKQLCVFRRAQKGIVQDACYPILGTQVSTWPQWVVASDTTAKRVRLVDDTHRRRLRIVPENVEMDDSVRVRTKDFESLGKKVTAWRTGWVVLARDTPALSATTATQSAQQVRDTLERWRQAWESKQFDAYSGFYSPVFAPPSESLAAWRARKRSLFDESAQISVRVAPPSVFVLGDGNTVVTAFEQSYRSGPLESHDFKVLRWERQGERWLISVETTLAEAARRPRARRRRGG
jgi:negative regulator of sigma E activity